MNTLTKQYLDERMASTAPSHLMALNVGSRLGHYDVTTKIGEGGMGEVYQPGTPSVSSTPWPGCSGVPSGP